MNDNDGADMFILRMQNRFSMNCFFFIYACIDMVYTVKMVVIMMDIKICH